MLHFNITNAKKLMKDSSNEGKALYWVKRANFHFDRLIKMHTASPLECGRRAVWLANSELENKYGTT